MSVISDLRDLMRSWGDLFFVWKLTSRYVGHCRPILRKSCFGGWKLEKCGFWGDFWDVLIFFSFFYSNHFCRGFYHVERWKWSRNSIYMISEKWGLSGDMPFRRWAVGSEKIAIFWANSNFEFAVFSKRFLVIVFLSFWNEIHYLLAPLALPALFLIMRWGETLFHKILFDFVARQW